MSPSKTLSPLLTHPVLRFLARRVAYSLVVLVGVLIVVFALVHLVPGDPVRIALGTRYTPEAYDALRAASGLDQPLLQQFFGYVTSAVRGDPESASATVIRWQASWWNACLRRCHWPRWAS